MRAVIAVSAAGAPGRPGPPAPRQAGVSTLELLVSLLLISMMLAGLYTVLFQTQVVFETAQDAMELRQEARVALGQIVAELRMAGFDVGTAGAALVDARVDRLTFVADLDNGSPLPPCGAPFETAPGGGAERVTYRVVREALARSVDCWTGSAWVNAYADQPVVRGTGGAPIFRYYDADGLELTGPGGALSAAQRDSVRRIGVALTVVGSGPTAPGQPSPDFRIRSLAVLRNLR